MPRCVRRAVLVAVSMVAATAASAQNPQRWNGPYIGVNLGRGSADIDGSITVLNQAGKAFAHGPLDTSVDADGMFGGVQIGYNRRIGNFFAGLEADLQTADITGSSQASFKPPAITPFTYTASASTGWFATARVRAGFASDAMLIFVTGGLAFGKVAYDATYRTTGQHGTSTHLSSDETRVGYVLGAGLELALRSNWSLKVEYQFINIGDQGADGALAFLNNCAPTTSTVTTNFDTDIHTVRVGLNYRFDEQTQLKHNPLK